jgi:GAF domain-containing protein
MSETSPRDAAAHAPAVDKVHDPARLAALRESGWLDTAAEAPLDQLAHLAARLVDAPTALISLVDADRQYFKSAVGLTTEPYATTRETPLSYSFCRYAVDAGAPFVVEDAERHPLVRDNPAVEELGVRAYAGVPLVTPEGHALGTLCVTDTTPREWSPKQIQTLEELASSIMESLEKRVAARRDSSGASE